MSAPHEDFFIGWTDRLPPRDRGFITRVALGFLAAMLLLALGLARTMDDSGGGSGDWIAAADLQLRSTARPDTTSPAPSGAPDFTATPDVPTADLVNELEVLERNAIIKALEQNRFNKTAAAKQLGMSFRALRYRIKKLGIE
jgi:hypothetical protein